MLRVLAILAYCLFAWVIPDNAFAQQDGTDNSEEGLKLFLAENPFAEQIARDDPDELWSVVRGVKVIIDMPRVSGPARSGSMIPTMAEKAQLAANPALDLAYTNDPAETLRLLRHENESLRKAHLEAQYVR